MNASLDIAFLVSADIRAGTYFRYHNLAVALSRRGHRLTVYSQHRYERGRYDEEDRDGVRYIVAPSLPGDRYIGFAIHPGNIVWRSLTSWRSIMRHNVYHLFQPHLNAASVWLAVQSWRRSARPIQRSVFAWDWDDLWGDDGLGGRSSLLKRLETKALSRMERLLPRRADFVTAISHYLMDLAKQRGARKVSLLYNGTWKQEPVPDRAQLRARFGLRQNTLYLGFNGWSATELPWCFELLRHLDERVRLVCSGADISQYIADFPDVVTKVDQMGIMPIEQAKLLMQAVDIGLVPLSQNSFNESRLPFKFTEYLSAGVTVICSDIGEMGLLGKQLSGVILAPPDKEAWIQESVTAINRMLINPGWMRPEPLQLHARFSWDAFASELESNYADLLASRASQEASP